MEDQITPFKAWDSEQRKKRFVALFDRNNGPSIAQLMEALKNIHFGINSTFEKFYEVAFQFSNTPRIPLIKTPSYDYSVQLGASIGSPTLVQHTTLRTREEYPEPFDSDSSVEYDRADEDWDKYVEPPDEASRLDSGPSSRHKFVEEFRRDWTKAFEPRSTDPPIRCGFSIGKIVMESLRGISSTIEDTGYVLVLNISRTSLWMVYNYYPLDDQGDPVRFQPVESSRLAQLLNLLEDHLFDCEQLFDSVNSWDPTKPLTALPIPAFKDPPLRATMQHLVASPLSHTRLEHHILNQDDLSSETGLSTPESSQFRRGDIGKGAALP